MVFADPPYFLSSNGISCSGGKMVSVNKGDWDKSISIEEKHKFNRKWIKLCYQVLKDNGTIWVSGTYHNIYSVANCMTQLGYKIERKRNPIKKSYDFFDLFSSNILFLLFSSFWKFLLSILL